MLATRHATPLAESTPQEPVARGFVALSTLIKMTLVHLRFLGKEKFGERSHHAAGQRLLRQTPLYGGKDFVEQGAVFAVNRRHQGRLLRLGPQEQGQPVF